MESISLDRIQVNHNLVRYHYSVSDGLRCFFKTNEMFLEYENDMADVPISILTIPFVSCMAGLSWLTNSMLFVDEIDKTFYDSFFRIKRAYQELFFNTPLKGILVPSMFKVNRIENSQDSLLLFGGGFDCHCSFLRNREQISHVCNIYGWLSSRETVSKVDVSDRNTTTSFAERMGVRAHHVRSNFSSQFNHGVINKSFNSSYWYNFLHSLAFMSISVPLCLTEGLSTIFIASSFAKGRTNVKCASYITTDSEFAFAENGHVIHDGFELNRQQKVKYIVNYQKSLGTQYPVQACSFNDHNCCECEKCFRTIIEIVAENGNLKALGFDIKGSLRDHWMRVIRRDVALWGVGKESYYYKQTRQRMKENYENIEDKEFVDWFIDFDFQKAKQNGLIRYYRKNLFSILKRKLHL